MRSSITHPRSPARLHAFALVAASPFLAAQSPGLPEPIPAGGYSFVVVPDTQDLAKADTLALLNTQLKWIKDRRQDYNIQFALQLGDLTSGNARWNEVASAFKTHLLDAGIPLVATTGNHDYTYGRNSSGFNTVFGARSPYAAQPTLVAHFQDAGRHYYENSIHEITVGNRSFAVIALEFFPRAAVVEWARQVLANGVEVNGAWKTFEQHTLVFTTHAFLYPRLAEAQYPVTLQHLDGSSTSLTAADVRDVSKNGSHIGELASGPGTLYDDTWSDFDLQDPVEPQQHYRPTKYMAVLGASDTGWATDGRRLWEQLIARQPRASLVFCGHVIPDGASRLAMANLSGNPVHMMLSNSQNDVIFEEAPGQTLPRKTPTGYLRLVTVDLQGRIHRVQTFSPLTTTLLTHPDQRFDTTPLKTGSNLYQDIPMQLPPLH